MGAALLGLGCATYIVPDPNGGPPSVFRATGQAEILVQEGDFLEDGSCPKCRKVTVKGGEFSAWDRVMSFGAVLLNALSAAHVF